MIFRQYMLFHLNEAHLQMFDLVEFCHCSINWGFSSVIPLYTSIFLDYLGVSQIQQPRPPLLGLGWFVFIGGGGGRAWDSLQMWALYSTANDPQPQMIRRPQMIPKMDRKWSSTASDPQSRPQMIPKEKQELGLKLSDHRVDFIIITVSHIKS